MENRQTLGSGVESGSWDKKLPTWERTSQVSPFPARTSFKIYLVNDPQVFQTDIQIQIVPWCWLSSPCRDRFMGTYEEIHHYRHKLFSDVEFISIADTDFSGEMNFDKIQSLNRSPDKQSSRQCWTSLGFRTFVNAVRGRRALKQKFESVHRDSRTSNEIQIPPGGSKITEKHFLKSSSGSVSLARGAQTPSCLVLFLVLGLGHKDPRCQAIKIQNFAQRGRLFRLPLRLYESHITLPHPCPALVLIRLNGVFGGFFFWSLPPFLGEFHSSSFLPPFL